MQAYYENRKSITDQYDLLPSQRDNANYNEANINAAIRKKTKEYEDKKRTVDLIHGDKGHVITKECKSFVNYWTKYHAMVADNPESISLKQRRGQQLIAQVNEYQTEHQQEEKSDLAEFLEDLLPNYLDAYKHALELSLELMELKQKLDDLDLCQLQADNYHQKLDALTNSIRKAQVHSTALGEKAKSAYDSLNPLTHAWNHWIDLQGYHQRAKHFETSALGLERIVHELKKQQPISLQAARRKNLKEYEARCFIIETLTEAYNNIDRLSEYAQNAEDRQFQTDMALKLQQLDQHCRRLRGSGHESLRYIAAICWLLAAVVVVTAVVGLSLYLSGGTAAALVVSALTAAHLYPALISLAAIAGCSIALVTPLALGIGGGLAAGTFGLFGSGFGRMGQDKNLLSRSARQASALFLEDIPEASRFDSIGCK